MLPLSSEWDRMRDAYSATLLAGNKAVARMVANRFFRTVSGRQDLDAYYSGELVRLHTAIPGLVTKENQQRLLDAATKVGGDWTTPYTAAIHYRMGNLEKAQPLLEAPQKDREFHAMAAMLLYERGETTLAAGFLNRAQSWLQQESAKDPHSAIPAQVAWDIWTVNQTVWREAARKLISPRIAELDELLAKEPDRSAELLERARLLTNVGLVEDALRDLQSLVTQNVTSPESSALHGRILAGLGRDEEALPYLSQAIDSGSLDSNVYAAHLPSGSTLVSDYGRPPRRNSPTPKGRSVCYCPSRTGSLPWPVVQSTRRSSCPGPTGPPPSLSSGSAPACRWTRRTETSTTFSPLV